MQRYIDGTLTELDPEDEAAFRFGSPSLAQVQAVASAQVNAQAGACRARYATDTFGQEGTYIAKQAEAAAFLADPSPDPGKYPYTYAEAGQTGMTPLAVAQLIQTTAQQWTALNSQIEGLRRGALVRIAAAQDFAQVKTAASVAWP